MLEDKIGGKLEVFHMIRGMIDEGIEKNSQIIRDGLHNKDPVDKDG